MSLLERLCDKLSAEYYKGRWHADCPFCGKPVKKGHTHFTMSEGGSFKCFACDAGGGLGKIAQHLDLPFEDRPTYVTPTKKQPPPARWTEKPGEYLARYKEPLTLYRDWHTYKRLTPASVGKFQLGRGKLPFWDADNRREYYGKYDRLIVPTFENGRCVGIEGRVIHPDDQGAKWLCATGTRKDVLFNAQYLRSGATVIIAENKVDCILAMQQNANFVAVTGGGSFWLDEWTALIAASRPKAVVVCRDNDLVGQANSWTYRVLIEQWRQKTRERIQGKNLPMPKEPVAMGPVIANQFLHYGIKTMLRPWPQNTPAKADLGWALMQDMEGA